MEHGGGGFEIGEISSGELAALLYHHYLQLLVIDISLPHPTAKEWPQQNSNGTEAASAAEVTVKGSYRLTSLARNLAAYPQKGSVILTLCSSHELRDLLNTLQCPYLVVIDESGREQSQLFCQYLADCMLMSAESSTFKCLKWVRYLTGGLQRFSTLFPSLLIKGSGVKEFNCEEGLKPFNRNKSLSEQQTYDPPSLVIPNLYLGGMFGTDAMTINRIRYHHLMSVGELPLFVSDFQLNLTYSPLISPFSKTRVDLVTKTLLRIPLNSYSAPASSSSASSSENSTEEVVLNDVIASSDLPPKRSDRLKVQIDVTTNPDSASNVADAADVAVSAADPKDNDKKKEDASSKYHLISHYMFTLEDISHAPIDVVFLQSSRLIDTVRSANELVFIHCHAGVSRSATIVIAYLIYTGLTLAESFALTFHARPCIKPNDGFWRKLQIWEAEYTGKVQTQPDMLLKSFDVDQSARDWRRLIHSQSTLPLHLMKLVRPDRVETWLSIKHDFLNLSKSQ